MKYNFYKATHNNNNNNSNNNNNNNNNNRNKTMIKLRFIKQTPSR